MKIAVTGHSRGLGKELQTQLMNRGHIVDGFSRSNGHDLRDWAVMMRLIDSVQDHDMLISVAKPDFVQTILLYHLWKRWLGKNKTIINISTALTYMPTCPSELAHDPMIDLYRTAKISLNEACLQLTMRSDLPRLLVIKPCHLYGHVISPGEQQRLEKWVNSCLHVIDHIQTSGFVLKEITF